MDFTLERSTGAWTTTCCFRGSGVIVRLKDPQLRPASTNESIVRESIQLIQSKWDQIQDAFETELYALYLATWVPEGQSALTRQIFTKALSCEGIQIEVEEGRYSRDSTLIAKKMVNEALRESVRHRATR